MTREFRRRLHFREGQARPRHLRDVRAEGLLLAEGVIVELDHRRDPALRHLVDLKVFKPPASGNDRAEVIVDPNHDLDFRRHLIGDRLQVRARLGEEIARPR